jgi:hypothetical protein
VTDCNGAVLGYAATTSDCVQNETAYVGINSLPELKLERRLVQVITAGGKTWKYWSDGVRELESLPVAFCPSVRLLDGGYGYHEYDERDPAATVVIAPCAGDGSVDKIYVYPTPAPGRTARQNDCDGNLIGYGVNRSDCAADCGCAEPTPALVTHALSKNGVLTSMLSNGSVVTSNPLPSC